MASGISIQIQGLDKLISKLNRLGPELQTQAFLECQQASAKVVEIATRNAPHDEGGGGLRSTIRDTRIGNNFEVTVSKNYAAYQEFGTKSKFRAPAELGSYPNQFRNMPSTGVNPIDALTGWVHRKGLARGKRGNIKAAERSIAFLIFRKIKKEGVKPHPFLFPAFFLVRGQLLARLQQLIKEEISK